MYIPGLNVTTDTSKLLSDLKLTQDQIVTAKSFIEFLHDAQMKIKKDEMNDKIKAEKLEKEINQRIDSEIKSGSKLPLEIYNKIADEEVRKKINEVNESIRRLSAKRAYGDFSMIKLPVRARINFARYFVEKKAYEINVGDFIKFTTSNDDVEEVVNILKEKRPNGYITFTLKFKSNKTYENKVKSNDKVYLFVKED